MNFYSLYLLYKKTKNAYQRYLEREKKLLTEKKEYNWKNALQNCVCVRVSTVH